MQKLKNKKAKKPGQREMISFGVLKCQRNQLDEVVTAAGSTRAKRPQRTSGRRVMTWYVALRQSQTWRI